MSAGRDFASLQRKENGARRRPFALVEDRTRCFASALIRWFVSPAFSRGYVAGIDFVQRYVAGQTLGVSRRQDLVLAADDGLHRHLDLADAVAQHCGLFAAGEGRAGDGPSAPPSEAEAGKEQLYRLPFRQELIN